MSTLGCLVIGSIVASGRIWSWSRETGGRTPYLPPIAPFRLITPVLPDTSWSTLTTEGQRRTRLGTLSDPSVEVDFLSQVSFIRCEDLHFFGTYFLTSNVVGILQMEMIHRFSFSVLFVLFCFRGLRTNPRDSTEEWLQENMRDVIESVREGVSVYR